MPSTARSGQMSAPPAPASALSSSSPQPRAEPTHASRGRRLLTHAALYLLALMPVLYVLGRAADANRNVVYWDEFDTDLQLVLRLDQGVTASEFVQELFATANEHRILTRRLLTSAMFGVLGTLDFQVLGALGNASILVLCGLLLWEARTPLRRVRLTVLLGLIVFNLEHYENILWPGSSLDHFLIVLIAAAALLGVARRSRAGLFAGIGLAALATFTLAHGMMTWPVGAAMLWRDKRRRALLGWGVAAALVIAGFLLGFRFNPSHTFADTSLSGALDIGLFWLALLGAVPALGHQPAAPWAGLVLLGLVGWAAQSGAIRRERLMFPLVGFALAAMALIAVGRAQNAGGLLHSRYLILGALAWALTVFMLVERHSSPRRPLAVLLALLPVLIGFNLAANVAFAHETTAWAECRDRAVVRFIENGEDGKGPFKLHPVPAHATRLLEEAERRGIYRLPAVCEPRIFPDAAPSTRIVYHIDEIEVNRRVLAVAGWAAIQGRSSQRDALHLVLRSEQSLHVFEAVTVSRDDVVKVTQKPGWLLSGFRFARARDRLPAGEYQVGVLIKGRWPEYVMTGYRVNLEGEGKAFLATGN